MVMLCLPSLTFFHAEKYTFKHENLPQAHFLKTCQPTYTHAHTHTPTHTNTNTHTQTHTHTHTCIHTIMLHLSMWQLVCPSLSHLTEISHQL